MARLPKIPDLLNRKIYKTGQTRGADDDQIFQNRVGRNSTVLIPLHVWVSHQSVRNTVYENGFIVLVPPTTYYDSLVADGLPDGLVIGENALIFYERREDWLQYEQSRVAQTVPISRQPPLGGEFVARIANTTAVGDRRINEGYTTTGLKGAGIRLYEYADIQTLRDTRLQLEALFWHTVDYEEKMILAGMRPEEISARRSSVIADAAGKGFLDYHQLIHNRILNAEKELVCPLCLEPISSAGFLKRLPQASGRERHDLTVTEINLFHIEELAFGVFNHRLYNLGWGHHHCNVVCKDSGIVATLEWMGSVMDRNAELDLK